MKLIFAQEANGQFRRTPHAEGEFARVNLAQRFSAPSEVTASRLCDDLVEHNPALAKTNIAALQFREAGGVPGFGQTAPGGFLLDGVILTKRPTGLITMPPNGRGQGVSSNSQTRVGFGV